MTLSSLLHYELCPVSVWDPKNTSCLVRKKEPFALLIGITLVDFEAQCRVRHIM